MIVITVEKQGSFIKKININGHARYDVKGSDIVCAGVSTLFFATVNTLGKLFEEGELFKVENMFKGNASIIFSNKNEVQILALNLLTGFENIKYEYTQFLTIEEVNING
ncbi:MAG: ribosomal-processing cysteine protease Prp [Candidatus Muirbacterium halophilum]|nr:ribosomal-processing cysteine protease Prp [Candidatus Muirbacterium halophilum]